MFNVTIFIIQGFSFTPGLKLPIFVAFLIIYLTIIFGNTTIFAVIALDSHLHVPMYVFLSNLSFLDILYSSTILPKLLVIIATQNKAIAFTGCMVQMYFFMALACTEFLLLAVMAYDRYVAVCHPLHYFAYMSLKHCVIFASLAWAIGLLDPILHTVLIANLNFCLANRIDHFFCDVAPLLKLTCSETTNIELLNYIEGSLLSFSAFILTLVSYIFIISSILKISSTNGRQKAFSTCSSHLTCVVIFYGTIICLYMRPSSSYSPKRDKFFALLYVALIPLLNPFIYTLKNTEFKQAMENIWSKASLIVL
ncbi:olfactory receptor 1C1-like [Spea bombifrons]|uniref:olfactory receptor 1C1-like n=1 Tax=Spea bombifrons TaxID=233779 RepID=UPI00234B939A|nr:olfactory receptor 1C1-like [Spea bombifrons]